MAKRKVISEEFLRENGFEEGMFNKFKIQIKNSVFHSVEISVEVISPAIGSCVAIKTSGTTKYSILPIDYEDQLTKLLEALKGE